MSKDESILIGDCVSELTDVQQIQIETGVSLVKDWVNQCCRFGSFLNYNELGLDFTDNDVYKEAQVQLKKIKIYITDHLKECLENNIINGKLHFRESILAEFGGKDNAMFAFQMVNEQKNMMNQNQIINSAFKYVKEPVLFFNPKAFSDNVETDDNLYHFVAAELVKVLGLSVSENLSEAIISGYLKKGVSYNSYLDSEKEIYARLIKFRNNFDFDKKHEFTILELKDLYKKYYRKITPYLLFDRYDYEQICDWLNYTSGRDKSESAIINNNAVADEYEEFNLLRFVSDLPEKEEQNSQFHECEKFDLLNYLSEEDRQKYPHEIYYDFKKNFLLSRLDFYEKSRKWLGYAKKKMPVDLYGKRYPAKVFVCGKKTIAFCENCWHVSVMIWNKLSLLLERLKKLLNLDKIKAFFK